SMTRLSLLLAAPILVLFLTACSDDSDDTTEASATASPAPATSTPASEASPTATVAPAASATPAASTPIDADNFANLEVVSEGRLDGLQFPPWQPDGLLLIGSTQPTVVVAPGNPPGGGLAFAATSPDGIQTVAVSERGKLAVAATERT